jgi:hypothetical protein
LAHQYRRIFDTSAGIILRLCAANNQNPWVSGGGPLIPAGVPLRSLIEIDNRVPAICLFRVYARQTFEERRFSTIAEGLEHICMLQKVCCTPLILFQSFSPFVSRFPATLSSLSRMVFVHPSRKGTTAGEAMVRRCGWPKSSSDIALLLRSPREDTPT